MFDLPSKTLSVFPLCTPSVRILIAGLASWPLAGAAALAQAPGSGPIVIEQPWVRATPGGAKLAAGYLVIRNQGDAPDRLISASAEPAGNVSPHSMSMTGGMMQMRALPAVDIPAHGSVAFKPGADHLMLEALKRPLKKGESFAGTLTFEKAGTLTVRFAVEDIGAKGPGPTTP